MTFHQAQLQALITEIEALIGKAAPKLPWGTSNANDEQRRILEQTLTYLKELEQSQRLTDETSLTVDNRDNRLVNQRSVDAYESIEATSHQVLQALLQEMQYLRAQMVQPLTNEVMALQQQRETLRNEVLELERRRASRVDDPDAILPNPAWVDDMVVRLRSALSEQLMPQISSLQAQMSNLPLLPTASLDSRELSADLPQLTPQQRLDQLQQIQAQTDYMLLKLDANFRTVFESLGQSIQSYCDTLSQGLDEMHGLGQQGEFVFRTFIDRLARQLQQESIGYLTSSEADDIVRLEGRERRFENLDPASEDSEQIDSGISLEEVNLENVVLEDDIDIDVDEEVTLFQLDGDFAALQLDDDSTDIPDDSVEDYTLADASDGDETIIQMEPMSWAEVTQQALSSVDEKEESEDDEDTIAYTEEIDSLYANLFGNGDTSEATGREGDIDASLNDDGSLREIEQSLLSVDLQPDLEMPSSLQTVEENEAEIAPLPEDAGETVIESLLETTPQSPAPSLLDLSDLVASGAADEATDSISLDEPADISPLETLLGAELGTEITEELTPSDKNSDQEIDTISSLSELLPDVENRPPERFVDPFMTFDDSGDRFIPAPPNEDLIDVQDFSGTSLELELTDDTLEKLTSDLSMLEGLSPQGLDISSPLELADTTATEDSELESIWQEKSNPDALISKNVSDRDISEATSISPSTIPSEDLMDESLASVLDNFSLDLELPGFSEPGPSDSETSENSILISPEAIAPEETNQLLSDISSDEALSNEDTEDWSLSFEETINTERLENQDENLLSLASLDPALSLFSPEDKSPSADIEDEPLPAPEDSTFLLQSDSSADDEFVNLPAESSIEDETLSPPNDVGLPLTGDVAEGFSVSIDDSSLEQSLTNLMTEVPNYDEIANEGDTAIPAQTAPDSMLLAQPIEAELTLTGSSTEGFQIIVEDPEADTLAETLVSIPAASEDGSNAEQTSPEQSPADESLITLYGKGKLSETDEEQLISATEFSFASDTPALLDIPDYDPQQLVAIPSPSEEMTEASVMETFLAETPDPEDHASAEGSEGGLDLIGTSSEGYAVSEPEYDLLVAALGFLPDDDSLSAATLAPEAPPADLLGGETGVLELIDAADSGTEDLELDLSISQLQEKQPDDDRDATPSPIESIESEMRDDSEIRDDIGNLATSEEPNLFPSFETELLSEIAPDGVIENSGPLSDDELADFFPPQVPETDFATEGDRDESQSQREEDLNFTPENVDSTTVPVPNSIEANLPESTGLETLTPESDTDNAETALPELRSDSVDIDTGMTEATLSAEDSVASLDEILVDEIESATVEQLSPPPETSFSPSEEEDLSSITFATLEEIDADLNISELSDDSADIDLNISALSEGSGDIDLNISELADEAEIASELADGPLAELSTRSSSAPISFEEEETVSEETESEDFNFTLSSETVSTAADWDPLTVDFAVNDSEPSSDDETEIADRNTNPPLFANLDLSFEEMSAAELENDDFFHSAFGEELAMNTAKEQADQERVDFSVTLDEAEDIPEQVSDKVEIPIATLDEAEDTLGQVSDEADPPMATLDKAEDTPEQISDETESPTTPTDQAQESIEFSVVDTFESEAVSITDDEDHETDQDSTDEDFSALSTDESATISDLFETALDDAVALADITAEPPPVEFATDLLEAEAFVSDEILDETLAREDIPQAPPVVPQRENVPDGDVLDEDASDNDVLDSDSEDAEVFDSSNVLATIPGENAGETGSDADAEEAVADEWFLGIDLGTNGLSAVLMNYATGSAHPLCWLPTADSDSSQATYRMPAIAALHPSHSSDSTSANLISVGMAALPNPSDPSSEFILSSLRPLLKVGIPHQTMSGAWEPIIQWTETQPLPLQQIVIAVERLMKLITHVDEADLHLEAVGIETHLLPEVLANLQGIAVGIPSKWPDTYCLNMRETILSAGLVSSPDQIFFLEEAIAAILSGLPDPHVPLPDQGRQSQTLYQCNWQGGTVVINGGAICTEVGMVDIPRPLDTLSQEDFILRNLAYGGDALDLDIVCQLLVPSERRQFIAQSDRRQPKDGWSWQATLPEVANAHWEDLRIEAMDMPQLAEPDPEIRTRLRRHLESSQLGQSLLEAARYLKLILQHQNQYQLELADQSWRVLRRDLESRVLVPYIQRINQQVNGLLSETGSSSQGINQVVCTGGNASFSTIAKWLRQKFPNATIIQDTYPSNRPQTCSRVAYGLANLCRYPQVLDMARHQYGDYFLLHEVVRIVPETPMPIEGILHLLQEQGINTDACRSRIEAILQGHLPPGFVPDASTQAFLSESTLNDEIYRELAARKLFTQQTRNIYMLNSQQRDRVQNHLAALMLNKHQTLTEPMFAELVTL